VAFKAQLKRAQDMRMVQLQALLGQVASLDPADTEVSGQPAHGGARQRVNRVPRRWLW